MKVPELYVPEHLRQDIEKARAYYRKAFEDEPQSPGMSFVRVNTSAEEIYVLFGSRFLETRKFNS